MPWKKYMDPWLDTDLYVFLYQPLHGSVTLHTAGQRCTQSCIANTHSHACFPGCVLIMAAWQGFAYGGFFSQIRVATSASRPHLSSHILFGCFIIVHAFQEPRGFAQNLSFTIQHNTAGLCAIGRAVCFQHVNVQCRRAMRLVDI